jgi:hypothetical protein
MSLHDKALLIDLTLTSVTTSRIDQTVTADVLHRAAAAKDAGRWVSRLWPKAALEGIIHHDSATGRTHREMTLPWLDNSKRILPTARFDDYMAVMRTRRPERAALVKTFIDNYPFWLAEAADMRQGLFKYAEYPDAFTAAQRFTFKVEAEPVPHRDDFRIRLSTGDLAEMQSVLDDRLQAAERIARNDLVARIVEPLVRIVDRLSDPDAKFQDSLIGNIRTIADSIPALNVTDDTAIEDIRLRILAGLATLDPDTLRESRSDRSRAATEANAILASFAPWMEPINQAA